jgi:hypothetical protein
LGEVGRRGTSDHDAVEGDHDAAESAATITRRTHSAEHAGADLFAAWAILTVTMPIAHSVKPPETVYQQTQLSGRGDQGADFEDVRARVRRFTKQSLVAMGARILWALWKDPNRYAPEGPERAFAQLVWAHAAGLIGMAGIYAPEVLRRDANSADFALLAFELFLCVSGGEKARVFGVRPRFSCCGVMPSAGLHALLPL